MKLMTDGTSWTIKRWSWLKFCFVYLDFKEPKFWWKKKSLHWGDCWTDKMTAETWLRRYKS